MKAHALLIASPALLVLTACDGAADEAPPAEAPATEAISPPAPVPAGTPTANAIPASIQGRWGMTAADCEPGRDDAKGLLAITTDKLEFYESVGTLDDVKELGENRIRAEFDFIGEGQEWQRDVTLEAREGGTQLVRREDGADAAPGEFRYTKCG